MSLSYDVCCKLIGELYIEDRLKLLKLEEQCTRLMLINKELEKKNVKENVDGLPTEGTAN